MSSIPSIHRAMVGRRLAVEKEDDRDFGETTYEYAAVIEFQDRSGLVDYLKNPLHLELGRLFWLHCARTVVVEVDAVDAKTGAVVGLLVEQ